MSPLGNLQDSQLLEAAWAGKGSTRGSGLFLLAQEQSQPLQSCCEVMPGAVCVLLQVETDSSWAGWQPELWRAYRENNTTTGSPGPGPFPLGLWGVYSQVGILALVYSLCSLQAYPTGNVRLGRRLKVRSGLPWPPRPSAQVLWTC